MHTARLRDRVPSARAAGPAYLTRHSLRWHKHSGDGSGKCDAFATGTNSDLVWGVLFEIDSTDKSALDRAEGLNHGYAEKFVTVNCISQSVDVQIYYATKINSTLKPYLWYKAFVVAGAREHELPDDYVRLLDTAPAIADPDTERAAMNQRILVSA